MKLCSKLLGLSVLVLNLRGMTFQPDQPAPVETPISWERSAGYDGGLTSTAFEDDARGNWYIKRKFLIDARALYEQIKERVPVVAAREKYFTDARNALAQEVAQFNEHTGFEPKELDMALTATIRALDEEREKNAQLTEKERETYANLELIRKELVQVQQDLVALQENLGSFEQALPVLTEQIRICTEYEQQAFDKYDRISEVLNDTLAEQLYNDIKSFLNHINAIDGYIQGQFKTYFDQMAVLVKNQMESTKAALKKLQEKGVEFESEATKELRKKKAIVVHKETKEPAPAPSMYERVVTFFKNIGHYLAYPFVALGNYLGSLWG